ncbi:MAG: hypothetical protein PHE49_08935 [bacterium]|nr:hypothetical protein [bacterium]
MKLKINLPEAEQKLNSLKRIFLCSIILLVPLLVLAQQLDDDDSEQEYSVSSFSISIIPILYNVPLKSDFELPVSRYPGGIGMRVGGRYYKVAGEVGMFFTNHYFKQMPDSIFKSQKVGFSSATCSFKYYFYVTENLFQPYCFAGIDVYNLSHLWIEGDKEKYGLYGSSNICPKHFGAGFDYFLNKYFSLGIDNLVELIDYSTQTIGSKEVALNKHIRGVYWIPSVTITYRYR